MDRFKDLVWFPLAERKEITLIGVGGIGSWAAILLARAGFLPVIMDDDIVDSSNISGQFFFKDQVMQEKVVAIQHTVDYFGGELGHYVSNRFTENTSARHIRPITIVGTDNMKSRKDVFLKWEREYNYHEGSLFVDGRLNAESFQIFCIQNREDGIKYKDYLYNDNEIEDVSCTAKQTTHYAAMIAANITRFITNFLSSETGLPTYVPFLYEINGVLPDQVNIAQEQVKQPEVIEVKEKSFDDKVKEEEEKLSEIINNVTAELHEAANIPREVIQSPNTYVAGIDPATGDHGITISGIGTGTTNSILIDPNLPF